MSSILPYKLRVLGVYINIVRKVKIYTHTEHKIHYYTLVIVRFTYNIWQCTFWFLIRKILLRSDESNGSREAPVFESNAT